MNVAECKYRASAPDVTKPSQDRQTERQEKSRRADEMESNGRSNRHFISGRQKRGTIPLRYDMYALQSNSAAIFHASSTVRTLQD